VPAYLVSVCSHGNAERSCESEVSQLKIVMFIDEKVLGFEVSM